MMEKKKVIFYLVKVGGVFIIIILSLAFILFSLRPKLLYFKRVKEEMRKNQEIIDKFDREKTLFIKESEDERNLWKEVKEELRNKVREIGSDEEIFSHFSSLLREMKEMASALGIVDLMIQSQSKSFTVNVNPNPSLPLFIKGFREIGIEEIEGIEDFSAPIGKLNFVSFKILYSTDIKTSALFIRNLPSLSNLLSIERIEVYAQESKPVYAIYVKFYFKRKENA